MGIRQGFGQNSAGRGGRRVKPYFQKFSSEELPEQLTCCKAHGRGRAVIVGPHWHPEIECYLMLSGRCLVHIEQQRFTAVPGDLIVVNRDQLHALYSVEDEPCVYLLLIFDFDSVVGSERETQVFRRQVLFRNPMTADTPGYHAMRRVFFDLTRASAAQQPGQVLVRYGLAQQLCGLLITAGRYDAASESDARLDRSRAMVESTFQLIQERYDQPLSLEAAARAASLSVSHFCRVFRSATGMTFNDYLSYYRVRQARTLLKADATLEKAAQECGFGSTASLIRCFHKFYQAPPKAYIRQL